MTERRQEPLRADAMSAQNYADTMTPNSPAAGSTGNLPGPRDFFRLDRRNVVLGLTGGVIAIAMTVLVGFLFDWWRAWPGGWAGTVLASLSWLAVMALAVQAIPRIVAAYDRREAERSGVSSG